MTFRRTIVRRRLAAQIACSLIATILPVSAATAEYGIPAGSGAVITAGQPLLVRATPGWDAEASYEIADGSYVTVWDAAQTAPDGSMWYPVDGGFVPVDAVTSVAPLDGGVALYQEAAPAAAEEAWVDPAAAEWVEPAATELVAPVTEEWVEPAPVETALAQDGWVDPATGTWVEPAPVAAAPVDAGWVDPATGEWVKAAPAEAVLVETAPLLTAPAGEGWVDPATGAWVEPAPAPVETAPVDAAPVAELVAPAPTEEWVEPAPVEPAPVDMAASGGVEPWGQPIAMAYIAGTSGEGAACRTGAERGTDKLAVLGEGESIEVRGEAFGEWQPVNCAGVGGYVNTSFISWEPLAVVEEEQRRGRDRDGNGGGGGDVSSGAADTSGSAASGSGNGQSIASFAMQYVGYPYAYAGEGPYAFDCSGFTKFVIQNTLGMDITHDMFQQIGMGQPVGMGELQPGDLVFFADTFRPGLSHVGIYVGGGQFAHAENESTGVKVSDLNSDYYGSRWAGATRLA